MHELISVKVEEKMKWQKKEVKIVSFINVNRWHKVDWKAFALPDQKKLLSDEEKIKSKGLLSLK